MEQSALRLGSFGLTVASVAVFWPTLKQCLTRQNAKIAATAFLAGALPFVVYNLRSKSASVSENLHIETDRMAIKWLQLQSAANGESLFGYITSEDFDTPLKPASSRRGRVAEWVWRHAGEHRDSQFFYVFGAMLALVPLWWRSRAAWFSLVFLTVAWSMMALTRHAGAAAHHVVLLWPFPILFAAIVLAAIPWRWISVPIAIGMRLR